VPSITGAPSGCQSFLSDGPRARLIEAATESKAIGAKSRANPDPAPRPGFIWAWRNDGTNAENELTTAETPSWKPRFNPRERQSFSPPRKSAFNEEVSRISNLDQPTHRTSKEGKGPQHVGKAEAGKIS
jgi:hypothetical protein